MYCVFVCLGDHSSGLLSYGGMSCFSNVKLLIIIDIRIMECIINVGYPSH